LRGEARSDPIVAAFEAAGIRFDAIGTTSDSKYVATISAVDRSIRLWDPCSAKELAVLTCESPPLSLLVLPDAPVLAIGDQSGRVNFVRIENA
jgi:hypothetical protein